jgi:hypothetical protein
MNDQVESVIRAVVCREDTSLGLQKRRKKCVVLVIGEMLLRHMS